MTATDRARFFTGQYDEATVLTEFVPDPNAWRWAGEMCWETSTSGYTCTRPPGHTGRHAAGTGQQIAAIWGKRHRTKPRVPAGTRAPYEGRIPTEAIIRAIQDGAQ